VLADLEAESFSGPQRSATGEERIEDAVFTLCFAQNGFQAFFVVLGCLWRLITGASI
jgi:hypothetical protein